MNYEMRLWLGGGRRDGEPKEEGGRRGRACQAVSRHWRYLERGSDHAGSGRLGGLLLRPINWGGMARTRAHQRLVALAAGRGVAH